jgi:hypothetical protein
MSHTAVFAGLGMNYMYSDNLSDPIPAYFQVIRCGKNGKQENGNRFLWAINLGYNTCFKRHPMINGNKVIHSLPVFLSGV